jgi:hypothetical protein
MACHWIGVFHHMIRITNAAAVDISLQLIISAQAVGMTSSFKPRSAKHAPLHISSS